MFFLIAPKILFEGNGEKISTNYIINVYYFLTGRCDNISIWTHLLFILSVWIEFSLSARNFFVTLFFSLQYENIVLSRSLFYTFPQKIKQSLWTKSRVPQLVKDKMKKKVRLMNAVNKWEVFLSFSPFSKMESWDNSFQLLREIIGWRLLSYGSVWQVARATSPTFVADSADYCHCYCCSAAVAAAAVIAIAFVAVPPRLACCRCWRCWRLPGGNLYVSWPAPRSRIVSIARDTACTTRRRCDQRPVKIWN